MLLFVAVKMTPPVFCRFNGQAREGMQALDSIHSRASYELYADVLLVRTHNFFHPLGE